MFIIFPLILNYSIRSLYSQTNSYNSNAVMLTVSKGAWATCGVPFSPQRLFFHCCYFLVQALIYLKTAARFIVGSKYEHACVCLSKMADSAGEGKKNLILNTAVFVNELRE